MIRLRRKSRNGYNPKIKLHPRGALNCSASWIWMHETLTPFGIIKKLKSLVIETRENIWLGFGTERKRNEFLQGIYIRDY